MGASGSTFGGGNSGGGSFGSGGSSILSALKDFLDPDKNPYDEGWDKSKPYYDKGEATQTPYVETGKKAGAEYTDWLNGQKDPSKFVNGLMNDYQESPYAKYLQQQSVRAGTNAASASGLTGSTAFAQQLQQNATNIAGQDQQDWLSKVLGINTQYGEGLNNQVTQGQHASDNLNQLFQTEGSNKNSSEFGSTAFGNKQEQDKWGDASNAAQQIIKLLMER